MSRLVWTTSASTRLIQSSLLGTAEDTFKFVFYSNLHIFQTNVYGIFTKLCIEIILIHAMFGQGDTPHPNILTIIHISDRVIYKILMNFSSCSFFYKILMNFSSYFFCVQCLKLSPNLRRQSKEVKLRSFDNYPHPRHDHPYHDDHPHQDDHPHHHDHPYRHDHPHHHDHPQSG